MVASSVSVYYLCQELGMIGGACLGGAVEGGVFSALLRKNGLRSEVSTSFSIICIQYSAQGANDETGGEGGVE